jgi:hypothetical protein
MHPAHTFQEGLPPGRPQLLQRFCQAVAWGAIKASSWGLLAAALRQPLDFRQHFNPRLVVAVLGETQPNPRHGVFFLLHRAGLGLDPEVVA